MLRVFIVIVGLFWAAAPLAQNTGPDYAAWERLASSIEQTLAETDPSEVYLVQQRANVAHQRQIFSDAQATNANRLATVREQIQALGPMPADGSSEAAEIANRRAELQERADALSAPGLRANEAFTRADGIIDEIDERLTAQKADQLLQLYPSPFVFSHWVDAAQTIANSVTRALNGVAFALNIPSDIRDNSNQYPAIAFITICAIILLTQSHKWVISAANWIKLRENDASYGFAAFVLSLGHFTLPYAGVLLLFYAVWLTDLYGTHIETLLAQLPLIAFIVFAARWIGNHIFNTADGKNSFVLLTDAYETAGRRMVTTLGIILAVMHIMRVFATHDQYSPQTLAVITFVLIVACALPLLRLAQLLNRAHQNGLLAENTGNTPSHPTGFGFKKRFAQAAVFVAIISVILVSTGYATAAQALMYPFIYTLAIVATLAILFEATRDFFAWISDDPQKGRDGLWPVLVNSLMLVITVPGLLLVWGMRYSDLTEYWASFRAGLQIGDTRISPAVFASLIFVFALGYFITRMLQRTLRTTVLPKTNIDTGGQNALVSGFGYIGIFLSALVAISSAGLDLSSIAIVAGALSVGIGFGLQNIVSNFVSGVILLIERPISEGDWIEVGGKMGTVKDISVRSTRIEAFDRSDVIVPNADLVSGMVTNYTRGNTVGRIIVPVGVAYGTNTRRVETILREIVEAHPLVSLNPAPGVVFTGFGADSLDFEIRAILRDINNGLGVKTELRHQIVERFAAEKIEIPFMQRDIWIKNPEALIDTGKDG